MTIKVKTLTGKEIEIDIEPSDTVERIKERVEEKEGIPPVQQRLIFGGKQMSDEKTARDYNIEGGTVLHLARIPGSRLSDIVCSPFTYPPGRCSRSAAVRNARRAEDCLKHFASR